MVAHHAELGGASGVLGEGTTPSVAAVHERIATGLSVRFSHHSDSVRCALALNLRQGPAVISALYNARVARQLTRAASDARSSLGLSPLEMAAMARRRAAQDGGPSASLPAAVQQLAKALATIPFAAEATRGVEAALSTTLANGASRELWRHPLNRAVAALGVHSTDPDAVLNALFCGSIPKHDARRLHHFLQQARTNDEVVPPTELAIMAVAMADALC